MHQRRHKLQQVKGLAFGGQPTELLACHELDISASGSSVVESHVH